VHLKMQQINRQNTRAAKINDVCSAIAAGVSLLFLSDEIDAYCNSEHIVLGVLLGINCRNNKFLG